MGLDTAIAHQIWDTRYRLRDPGVTEGTVEDTWRRVAKALASVEPRDGAHWEARFLGLLREFRFLPGGRILAGAGTGHAVTLFNCFVMGPVGDSMDAIFDALKEGAITMQQGGGVGYDFSTLRPAGTVAWRVGTVASGPVSFMRIWDSMCATLLSTAARRGAMMATLRCDHPDIETFVDAKRDPRELRNFNLSVLVNDAFLEAAERGDEWPLVFPIDGLPEGAEGAELVRREWSGGSGPVSCRVLRRVPARDLWRRIMRAAYDTAEPGVLFVDRINRENNLHYRERISASNPCGEIPLPPYGACDLGSLNLTRFVTEPFSERAALDWPALERAAADAVRFLDDVIDLSRFPFEAQAQQARGSRRVGLGITGLADALILLGLHYGSEAARRVAGEVMERICHAAYRASVGLAREKGPFPYFERDPYLASPFVRRLPADIRDAIARHGIRNSHLTAIAPTGTISLFAGNVSSGIEPLFDLDYRRRVRGADGEYAWHRVTDYAVRLWRERFGGRSGLLPSRGTTPSLGDGRCGLLRRSRHPASRGTTPSMEDASRDVSPSLGVTSRGTTPSLGGGRCLPDTFVTATALEPAAHLAMQAALQSHVDNAISKTINVPRDFPFEGFETIYREAHRLGLKGCTCYRPTDIRGAVLEGEADTESEPGPHCCGLEREGD